ncbi:MAG: MATE family efflux transporter [Clostridia bacterium]|nr:MATE family efflux transporter [Clostridia bacterium]
MNIKSFIGTKSFYKKVMLISIPIMLQNALTSVVNLLDNMMVGRLGTNQMSGVAIAGSLLFVFQMAIFGAVSGAGIFGAQFYGKGDHKGVADTLRIKLYMAFLFSIVGVTVFSIYNKGLIDLYLHEGDGADLESITETFKYAKEYLMIMLIGLPPMALSICYASSMRECGETFVPMVSGIIAVLTDLVLNWIMIFGNLGFPALGVSGAAIATVISRFTECIINMIWTHRHSEKLKFASYVFNSFGVPSELLKQIAIKGFPLMCNEIFWVLSITVTSQCYSYRGLTVVAANNINSTIGNVFNIVFIALGSAVGIIVGQQLGNGDIDGAHATTRKLIAFSVATCLITSTVMISVSHLVPQVYKTTEAVRNLASQLIVVYALAMPLMAYNHASYFAIRSGGKTFITLLFDSVYCWAVTVPIAYCLIHYTSMSIVPIYAIVTFSEFAKCILATIFLKKLNWAVNLVDN